MTLQFDIARHLGAVSRTVGTRERDGRPARVVAAARSYDAAPDEVWDAITSAERIPRWFLPVSGDLRLGGRYQLQGNAGGEITRCEPPRHLAITWEYGGDVSWVDVRLIPEGAGRTRLELEHVAHVPPEFWDQYGPGAVGVGWDGALLGLGHHLLGGPAVDPAAAVAWQTSPQGIEFTRHCSAGWEQASVAAGTDPAAAAASARRTTAFYTGTDPDTAGDTAEGGG